MYPFDNIIFYSLQLVSRLQNEVRTMRFEYVMFCFVPFKFADRMSVFDSGIKFTA